MGRVHVELGPSDSARNKEGAGRQEWFVIPCTRTVVDYELLQATCCGNCVFLLRGRRVYKAVLCCANHTCMLWIVFHGTSMWWSNRRSLSHEAEWVGLISWRLAACIKRRNDASGCQGQRGGGGRRTPPCSNTAVNSHQLRLASCILYTATQQPHIAIPPSRQQLLPLAATLLTGPAAKLALSSYTRESPSRADPIPQRACSECCLFRPGHWAACLSSDLVASRC